MWKPVFKINTAIARALMDIESAKAVVEITVLSPAMEAQLRKQARIRSTHYSTRVEGNGRSGVNSLFLTVIILRKGVLYV